MGKVAQLAGRIGWKGLTAKEYTKEGPLFLSVHSLNYGDYVDYSDAFHISQARYDESPEIMLRANDVLICKDGAGIGKLGIVGNDMPGPTTINSSLLLIRAQEGALPKYLYYILSSPYFQGIVRSRLMGATTPHLYQRDITEFPVYLPPITEQQRIVAILDETLAGLATATANAAKNLKNARDLFESYLNAIFENDDGSRNVMFGDVCSISSKLVDPREPEFIDLPHLGAGNISSRTGELSDIKTAREEMLKSGKFLFDSTMVLYSKIRPYLMKACRPNFEGLCSADVYPLSPKPDRLDRNFLFHLLMSKEFTDFAISGSDRAGMPKVNRDHLFKYQIKLPNIKEQATLARKLDELSLETNRLVAFYERRLMDIADLKQSILQKAFSGALTNVTRSIIPARMENVANVKRDTALVIALAYERHKRSGREKSLGRTKEQKILHMVEAAAEFNLGRRPIRDAAGPNDFHHMLAAEEWAKENRYFKVLERDSGGYEFRPLAQFCDLLNQVNAIDPGVRKKIERVIDMFIPMDMQESEVFATAYAAWNNILIEGGMPTDDAIIAACYAWHPRKSKIPRAKFVEGLRKIRALNCIPDGRTSFVPPPPQGQLPL